MSWRGRLSAHFKELRFVFNPNKSDTSGVVNFIESNYKELKTLNPGMNILIRSTEGDVPPVIYAAALKGPLEHEVTVTDWSPNKIEAKFSDWTRRAERIGGFDDYYDEGDAIAKKNHDKLESLGYHKLFKLGREFQKMEENSKFQEERLKLKRLVSEKYLARLEDLVTQTEEKVKKDHDAELDRIDQKGQQMGWTQEQVADEVSRLEPLIGNAFEDHLIQVAAKPLLRELKEDNEISAQLAATVSARDKSEKEARSSPLFADIRRQIEESVRIAKERKRGDTSKLDPNLDSVTLHDDEGRSPEDAILTKVLRELYEQPRRDDEFNIIDVNNPPQPCFWRTRV